jgi:hypothetical protein
MAIDVDGTLLHDDHHLSERTKKAIFRAQEKGIKVILATGRGPRSCDPLIEALNLNHPVITHNGAVVYHPVHKTAEQQVGYKIHELMPILEYCREHHIHFDANTAFDIFTEGIKDEYIPIYRRFFANPIILSDIGSVTDTIVKLTLTGERTRMDEIMADLVPRFPDFSIIRSGEIFIDVMNPLATKAHALRYMMKQFNVAADEVLAFGNYYNDLGMLEIAGTGVAMGNAPDEVKAHADWVAKSNNDDGVAQVIEQLLEEK